MYTTAATKPAFNQTYNGHKQKRTDIINKTNHDK